MTHTLDPVSAQQLVARYAAVVERDAEAGAFPAPVTALPAPKPAIAVAVATVVRALAGSGQLTGELEAFLEDVHVSLANYVDDELAALAAEHRRAAVALESDHRNPRERMSSPSWDVLARTSRLAGEIARASAEEAAARREEFRGLLRSVRGETPEPPARCAAAPEGGRMTGRQEPPRERRTRDREDEAPHEAHDDSIVRSGGIAPDEASAEDVTRDTYGFTETEPDSESAEERIAEANRAAAAAGIPGAAPAREDSEPGPPARPRRPGPDDGDPAPD